jgi:hypothetical protein
MWLLITIAMLSYSIHGKHRFFIVQLPASLLHEKLMIYLSLYVYIHMASSIFPFFSSNITIISYYGYGTHNRFKSSRIILNGILFILSILVRFTLPVL